MFAIHWLCAREGIVGVNSNFTLFFDHNCVYAEHTDWCAADHGMIDAKQLCTTMPKLYFWHTFCELSVSWSSTLSLSFSLSIFLGLSLWFSLLFAFLFSFSLFFIFTFGILYTYKNLLIWWVLLALLTSSLNFSFSYTNYSLHYIGQSCLYSTSHPITAFMSLFFYSQLALFQLWALICRVSVAASTSKLALSSAIIILRDSLVT